MATINVQVDSESGRICNYLASRIRIFITGLRIHGSGSERNIYGSSTPHTTDENVDIPLVVYGTYRSYPRRSRRDTPANRSTGGDAECTPRSCTASGPPCDTTQQ